MLATRVGYCGGSLPEPTYKSVCGDPAFSDYAETIQVDFDPKMVSYSEVLECFFRAHDATAGGRSRQYSSIIFAHDDEQRASADAVKSGLGRWVTTRLEEAGEFWEAEAYHQKWLLQRKRPLMLALSLTHPDDLLAAPARVLNAFAAGKLPAEPTLDRLDALLRAGEMDPAAHGKVRAALLG